MTALAERPVVQPGVHAPEFTLPAVQLDGHSWLADYRWRPLFLAIFKGLRFPFCRRNIAHAR